MIRKMRMIMWMVVLIGIFLITAAECRGADDPLKVTKDFAAAVKAGGAKAARPYITKASQAAVDQGVITLSPTAGDVLFGETKIQGNRATVIVTNTEKPDEQHTIFLMMEDGKWKVDLIKTVKAMLAGSDIGKQMEEALKKLQGETFEKLSAAMKAMGHELSPDMARAMGAFAPTKPKEGMFLLADMGWGDPFIHPRDRIKPTITPDDVIPELGDEKKKIWEDALAELMVEVIIGFEDDLAAVVAGVRVHPGDTIMADRLKFKVERITSDAVYLRCITEEEAYKKFLGITVKRKIPL